MAVVVLALQLAVSVEPEAMVDCTVEEGAVVVDQRTVAIAGQAVMAARGLWS